MTKPNFKQLILESITNEKTLTKFVTLHQYFVDQLKQKAVSFNKIRDTFNTTKLKDKWERSFEVGCSEINSVVVYLTNNRLSSHDDNYGDWIIDCYYDIAVGEVILTELMVDQILSCINEYVINHSDVDIFERLSAVCKQQANTTGLYNNDQAIEKLKQSLKANFNTNTKQGLITAQVGLYTISLIDYHQYWEVRLELNKTEIGSVCLNEGNVEKIVKTILSLNNGSPYAILTKLVASCKNSKAQYIENSK